MCLRAYGVVDSRVMVGAVCGPCAAAKAEAGDWGGEVANEGKWPAVDPQDASCEGAYKADGGEALAGQQVRSCLVPLRSCCANSLRWAGGSQGPGEGIINYTRRWGLHGVGLSPCDECTRVAHGMEIIA